MVPKGIFTLFVIDHMFTFDWLPAADWICGVLTAAPNLLGSDMNLEVLYRK